MPNEHILWNRVLFVMMLCFVLGAGVAMVWAQASSPAGCEDQRDDILIQSGQWQQAVGTLNKENRALRAQVAELQKPKKEEKKP